MRLPVPVRNIILIWLGWAVVLISFQSWVQSRVELKRPDTVLNWTATETTATSNNDQPYLLDPFLNSQVAWDSEFYLGIADAGYDAADIRAVPTDFGRGMSRDFCQADPSLECYSLSYAFFPVYPLLTRLTALPLSLLPITNISQVTLAAVIVSLLGALAAMLAIFFITRPSLGDEGGVRAAFYLLIFPSGFYLAQVYSEGLFLGITFASLAFLSARKWGWAALLAALAAWTRPGGAILVLPLMIFWIMERSWQTNWKTAALRAVAALTPAISFAAWLLSPLGERFFQVEDLFFRRTLFAWEPSMYSWKHAYQILLHGAQPSRIYYALEFAAIFIGIAACILLIKKRPDLSLLGLAMIAFAMTTGAAQGMVRYVLVAPPIFWMLACWGKSQAFDRVWTLLSILVMGLEVTLFTYDFWVA